MLTQHRSHTLRILIASMAAIAIGVGASTIALLYRAAYNETLLEMQQSASTAAYLIESVAQFDRRYSEHTHPQGHWGATMSQVEAGVQMQLGAQPKGEIIFGRRVGNDILVLRALPGKGLQEVARLPFDGVLARPLTLALKGERGSGQFADYAGHPVLAGYAPVPTLGIGIVYKMETAQVRAPFIRAGLWASAIGLLLLALGAWIFARVTEPLQRRLAQSQQRFAVLVSHAPVGVFETDAQGRCTFVNERWCEYAGLSPQQAMGEGWVAALHPEDKHRIHAAWLAFATQGAPFALEYRFQRPDGSVHWLFGQAAKLLDGDGKLHGYTGTVTDISEAVAARAALQTSDEHLREAQRLASVGSWELDLATHRLAWSDEIFRIFEIDQTQFGASYEAFLHAIHPDDRDAVNQAYTESVANRTPYQIEHRLLLPDGRIKWVQERCETFYDPDGRPLRSAGTVQDISQLKNALLELERYRTQLEQLVAQRTAMLEQAQRIARLGNWHWDVASGKIAWSDEIYRIFGHEPRSFEPSYSRFIAALHPDDVQRIKQSEQQAFARGERHSIDHRIVLPTGDIRWVHEEAVASFDAAGQALGLSGTVQDITERKLAEAALIDAKEEAERANRAKSEFLSRMSHELRTPMNAILGFAQVLQEEDITPEQLDFANEIHRAGKHLLHLINELLDLSRIEAGNMATRVQALQLPALVGEALQITRTLIQAKQIVCINHCDSPALVLADPTRLKQILVNLLSNAAKYNRVGGRILIQCQQREGPILRLSVTDNGPGIAPEQQALIFTPFERLGAEHTPVEGSGIGLALSKQLAELMGADLGLHSNAGAGATFWLDLPLAPASAPATGPAPTADDAPSGADRARFTVLYIEDNAANLKVVEAMFRHQRQMTLLSASNGEYGLALARRHRPDAILLDIHLPGMDGYAVLRALQADAATRAIPVLALSADAMSADVEAGLAAGFVRYLVKPVNLQALLDALQSTVNTQPLDHEPIAKS